MIRIQDYQDDVVDAVDVLQMIDVIGGMNIFYFYEINACLQRGTVMVDKQQTDDFWIAALTRMMALVLVLSDQHRCIDASFALK